MRTNVYRLTIMTMVLTGVSQVWSDDSTSESVDKRFQAAATEEIPSLQRHVVPLFGRLGCNGRACHGSFQGRGDFRLSLFGYDFKADLEELKSEDSPRIDLENPAESLILVKPTDEDNHEGGLRYEKDSWQYHVFRKWIEAGAPYEGTPEKLVNLEVTPSEIWFKKTDDTVQLKAIALWEDGTREDVTPLCRFKSNDDQVCTITEDGRVTATKTGDSHVVVSYDNGVVAVPVIRPTTDLAGAKYPKVETPTEIDKLVVQKLRKLGVVPSELSDDAMFLRRVSIDITGTLPAPEDVKLFLADKDPNKRAKKIDELLDTPAYAAWWTTKLCDFTGNNDQQLNNVNPMRGAAGQEWYDWINQRVADNTPYDDLASGIVTAISRKPDQDYVAYCEEMSDLYRDGESKYADQDNMSYYWARRDFRELEARAIGFAYSFMGIRIQCAQCHKHPFDQWSRDDFHQFKNLFSKVAVNTRPRDKEGAKQYNEMVEQLGLKGKRGGDLRRMLPDLLKDGKAIPFPEVALVSRPLRSREKEYPVFENAKLLGGDIVDIEEVEDPREPLMDWLREPNNRFFAPAFVNRVWASYFNVGIVNPPDDLSLANPPSNKPLLDYLSKGFVESGFDMKWLHRTITNSRTYQLSWKPNETNRLDEKNFSHAVPRRMPAEVAYDALQQATGSDERAAEMQNEMKGRSIAIATSSSRSSNNGAAYALAVFGRSIRESNCDCDRSMEATLLQTVFLQNDRDTLSLIEVGKRGWIDQIARELKPSKAKSDSQRAAQQVVSLRKQLVQMQAKLNKLKKADGKEAQVVQYEKRMKGLRTRITQLAPQVKAVSDKIELPEDKVADLVNQAYLRTLSRLPNDTEMSRSTQYIATADDTIDGVRDLLWALVNTKEFIVNH